MTVISKAALAAELRVSKPRVSQYIKRGMPVRLDGKLDRDEALNWLSRNEVSGGDQNKGPALARNLVKRDVRPPSRPAGSLGEIAVALAKEIYPVILHTMARSAVVELGLPIETAYALDQIVSVDLAGRVEKAVGRYSDTYAHGYSILEEFGPDEINPDWNALSAEVGRPFDQDACDATIDNLAWSNRQTSH